VSLRDWIHPRSLFIAVYLRDDAWLENVFVKSSEFLSSPLVCHESNMDFYEFLGESWALWTSSFEFFFVVDEQPSWFSRLMMIRVAYVLALCVIEYRGNCVVTAVLQLLFILLLVIPRIPRAFSLTISRMVLKLCWLHLWIRAFVHHYQSFTSRRSVVFDKLLIVECSIFAKLRVHNVVEWIKISVCAWYFAKCNVLIFLNRISVFDKIC